MNQLDHKPLTFVCLVADSLPKRSLPPMRSRYPKGPQEVYQNIPKLNETGNLSQLSNRCASHWQLHASALGMSKRLGIGRMTAALFSSMMCDPEADHK